MANLLIMGALMKLPTEAIAGVADLKAGYTLGHADVAILKALAAELLAVREAQSVPVQWGAPKTVRQLIQQLQTLDQDLETTALLRMPADFRDGNAIRQVPLSISYERMNGQWLAQYKSDGRLVLAFWAKVDDRPEGERGELLTAPPAPAVPDERSAFERFVAQRFGESVDQRRAKNGDNEYMAWDMAMAWIVWQGRAAMRG